MDETLEERLAAVERALTDGDHDLTELTAAGETAQRLDDLAADVAELDERIAELEAATQALRGYVGNVRAVNEEVEQRADLALETAEAALDGQGEPAAETAKSGVEATAAGGTRREARKTNPSPSTDRHTRQSASETSGGRQDCTCGAVAAGDDRDIDTNYDPTALATADRRCATDGGTSDSDASVLARIRDVL